MRFLTAFLALGAAVAGCAAPGRPVYDSADPLSGHRAPETVYGAGTSTGTRAALFMAVLPLDFAVSEATVQSPVAAVLHRDTAFGETAIIVERYGESDGAPVNREDFIAHLADGRPAAASLHGPLTAYHGLEFRVTDRRIGPDDPWREALGVEVSPPKLSPIEGRRFLVGGEAYRLYRCLQKDAWGVLGDYRRAQAAGKPDSFRSSHPPEERRLVSACFGSWVAHAVAEGRPLPPLPRPSHGALRGLAREEWERGAVTRRELECVVLLDAGGSGFWALRLRAPSEAFAAEHAAFLDFVATFHPS